MNAPKSLPIISPAYLIWLAVAIFALAAVIIGWLATSKPEAVIYGMVQVGLLVAVFFALILSMAGITLALRAYGLSQHEHAFGLPPGTVRACLALGLLVIFVGLGMYLYAGLGRLGTDLVKDEVLAEPTNLPGDLFAVKVGENHWQIYSVRSAEAQKDIAQQIFTTVATALASVIGFYFGSRAATSAEGAAVADEKTPSERARAFADSAQAGANRAKAAVARIEQAIAKLKAMEAGETNALRKAALAKELGLLVKRKTLAEKSMAEAAKAADDADTAAKSAVSTGDAKKLEALVKDCEDAKGKALAAAASAEGHGKAAAAAVERFKT